ncbi:cyclophilin-like protein [Rickenella mellea]|uniref:Cyclophilin-like protein n=1 Tax=Rickenella mellea TaxID=50990 RepID=A0A4Y7Q894_9AGAM|nr:cyclophilin-like protein [Rickenella mellea]
MALPTKGRVIIDTTVGELDIELWSKETPKTCRNFLALAMEGYYDGCIFHRVVPNFLVQTGDRTGTGGGGESFYGEPFEDEIHPRLRYSHRGLVGMANNGQKDSNDSQFFLTLDRADELHGKHTLFGRCVGDTVFNVMKIGSMELDANERPLYPPKIKSIRIVDNPFEDIVPRITAAEKRAQRIARENAQKEREEELRRRTTKKNTKLLSFEDEGDGELNAAQEFKKKPIVRPDLIDDRSQLLVDTDSIAPPTNVQSKLRDPSEKDHAKVEQVQKKSKPDDITRIREKHAKEQANEENLRLAQIQKLEQDIRKLNAKRDGGDESDDEHAKKKSRTHSALGEELAKYEKSRGMKSKKSGKGKGKDEGDVLARMNAFRGKLRGTLPDDADGEDSTEKAADEGVTEGEASGAKEGDGENSMEVDADTGFLAHKLSFPKDDGEESRKAERDYEVIDPRQRGARARVEERERKRRNKPRDGGRGSRR